MSELVEADEEPDGVKGGQQTRLRGDELLELKIVAAVSVPFPTPFVLRFLNDAPAMLTEKARSRASAGESGARGRWGGSQRAAGADQLASARARLVQERAADSDLCRCRKYA